MSQVVQKHLWDRYPPEPRGPEDAALEQIGEQEAEQEKARQKV